MHLLLAVHGVNQPSRRSLSTLVYFFKDTNLCSFNLKGNLDALLDFLTKHSIFVSTFTLCVYFHDGPVWCVLGHEPEEYQSVWEDLFRVINPRVVTIVAPPRLLGDLTMCNVNISFEEAFQIKYQILQLSMDNPTLSNQQHQPPNQSSPATEPRTILQIRPWTALLLNEGSHMPINFQIAPPRAHETPSILKSLLIARTYPPTATSLTYIDAFPFSSHFKILTDNLPAVRHLAVHLTPRITDGPGGEPAGPMDLQSYIASQERQACYLLLVRSLGWEGSVGQGNWVTLQEFESGDLVGEGAWLRAAQHVRQLRLGWGAGRRGVFVREVMPEVGGNANAMDGEVAS